MAQRPASLSSRCAQRPDFIRTKILSNMSSGNTKRARVALGQSSLARPGQLLQAPPPTGLVVGGQRKRGGRKVKDSWAKAEFERRETQQDGKTTVAYSCLHCERTLIGPNIKATQRGSRTTCSTLENEVPGRHLCARGGKAGGRGDDIDAKMRASHFQIAGTWRTPRGPWSCLLPTRSRKRSLQHG